MLKNRFLISVTNFTLIPNVYQIQQAIKTYLILWQNCDEGSWNRKSQHRMLLQPGHSIGEYRILDVIGDGGFSVVYKAEDRNLERLVAVKQLNPDVFTEFGTVERFKREAKLAASLNHPHIVSTYAWKQEGDQLFLVMEYLPGGSVRELIGRHGFLAPGTVVKLAAHVCQALEALHGRGIIHRDIKPENILCTADGEFKLADFGLAHNARIDPRHRSVGPQSGTLMYMSPEQALGEVVTERSDIYSLATVLYEALTGRYYLDLLDEPELIDEIIKVDPTAPSHWNEALDILDEPLQRALSKDPAQRQPSARMFYDELRSAFKRRRTFAQADLIAELRTIRILRDVLNEQEQAVARLNASWVSDSDYPEVLAERGEMLIGLGQVDEGVALLQQAVMLKSSLPFAQLALARLHREAGDVDAYADAMIAAIRADADLVYADQYETLINAIRDADTFWMLIGLFQRALEEGNAATHFNLGRAIALVKGYEREAIACFEQAIEIAPIMGPAYVAMGGVYLSLGEAEQAITLFERATVLEYPTFLEDEWLKNTTAYTLAHAYLGLVMAHNFRCDYQAGIAAANEFMNFAPADFAVHADQLVTTYIDAAAGMIHNGQMTQAYDLLIRAAPLAASSDDDRVLALLAHVKAQMHKARRV